MSAWPGPSDEENDGAGALPKTRVYGSTAAGMRRVSNRRGQRGGR